MVSPSVAMANPIAVAMAVAMAVDMANPIAVAMYPIPIAVRATALLRLTIKKY